MSLKWQPLHLVPNLSPEVQKETDENKVYSIKNPTQQKGSLCVVGVPTQDMIQLRCNSLNVKKPDTVCKCNSVVKTIIGNATGDQIDIVECGKCRTSYLVRTRRDENGELKITAKVWDISRNLKNFVTMMHNDDYDFLVKFN